MKLSHKIVETDKYRLTFHTINYYEILIKENVTFDAELLFEINSMSVNNHPHPKSCVLIEGVGFFNVKKEVRELSVEKRFSSRAIAVACFTKNPSLLLLGELYNKINKPTVQTKMFTNRTKAKNWLKSFIETDNNIRI
ncbi:MAG TPA: hypothetical protein VN698_11860 [Bacteroidia bacterium]|nr:hypothetical protein [Bacteroidia bacterium]